MFFNKTWHFFKHEVIFTVKHFFDTEKLFKPLNCAIVTLVSKIQAPTTVKDYRPITFCSIVCKLIFKI